MDKIKNISLPGLLPLILIYFFINSFALPQGLTFTFLLTPLFLFISIREKLIKPYFVFVGVTLLFLCIHTYLGIHTLAYLKSWLLLFSAFVFGLMVYLLLHKKGALSYIFKSLLIVNTLLIPVAIALYFTPFKESVWYLVPISPNLPIIPRLKMFTYEASYYSLLLAPIFLYYYLKVIFQKGYSQTFIAFALIVPLILSFSMGVLGGLAIALFLVYLSHLKWLVLHKRFRNTFLVLASLFLGSLLALWIFYPENPLFIRIQNIPNGADTSARGRTYEAFELAWIMAKEKSIWFGIGLGQIKILGRDVIIQYYQYMNMPEVARLPNAAAETLAQFGIIGLSFRIGLQIWLFFKTQVYQNFYRLSLFVFVFIYQFTGSFMVNMAEISLWIICFLPLVPELDKNVLHQELRIPEWKKKGESDG